MTEQYPNFPPDTLGDEDLKKIDRLPRMQNKAPEIKWGGEFLGWALQKQRDFAMRIASAMNHAADVLQQERNNLLRICASQERQLEQSKKAHADLLRIMNEELAQSNLEKQQLYQKIVELKRLCGDQH